MSCEFKVYVDAGKEYFEWSSALTENENKKDFELSQSLLDLLDLNIDSFFDLTRYMGEEIQKLYSHDVEHNITFLREGFEQLAKEHVFSSFCGSTGMVAWIDL